jgi:hypothetical protein
MHAVLVAALIVLLYLNPILIAWVWLRQVTKRRPVSPKWRTAMSWLSLSFTTIAVVIFWTATLGSRYPEPSSRSALRLGLYSSLTFATAAIVTAFLGEGKERKWAAISAFIIPLNWVMWAAFQ